MNSTDYYLVPDNTQHGSEEKDISFSIKFIVEGLLLILIGIIGLFGNTVCIIMFAKFVS